MATTGPSFLARGHKPILKSSAHQRPDARTFSQFTIRNWGLFYKRAISEFKLCKLTVIEMMLALLENEDFNSKYLKGKNDFTR